MSHNGTFPRQNCINSRAKQAQTLGILRPVPHNIQNRRTGPPSPRRTHPPSKHGKVCELRAEALKSSNQATRIEWSIVLRYDEAGLDAVDGDGSQHKAKESHIGTQLEVPS